MPQPWRLEPRPASTGPWPWLLPGAADACAWLAAQGLGRGRRVGLLGANTPAVAAMLQAAPLAGITLVLFNHRLALPELRRLRAAAAVDALLVAGGGEAQGLPDARPLPEDFDPHRALRAIAPLAGDDPALVVFTSGTSGAAKAARLSWSAVLAAAAAATRHLGLAPDRTWLACLPLDHIGGASLAYRSGVSGCALDLHPRFVAEAVDQRIDRAPIGGASLVPTMLHRLLALRRTRWPAHLRCLLVGGGPLHPADIGRCTGLGLAPSQTYGLTEAGSQVCTLLPGEAASHPGSAGRALPGFDLRLRADDGEARAGGAGRIEIRGPQLFAGYERDGVLAEPHPPGAWFTTGDLGRLDEDGFLTVLGRADDVVISGGENIHPAEIEMVLEEHPGIRAAGVCGLPDAEWGQVVAAVLVPVDAPLPDAQLAAWLAGRLAGFKRPRRWAWHAGLPLTPGGKLRRAALPGLFAGPG